MSDTYSCSLLLFQNVPIQPSSNLFISPCSYPSLHQFIHGNNCQSIHLSNKSRSQEALEVPLGQVQNRRLLRTDRLTIALEDDVILASKLAMMHSGQKSWNTLRCKTPQAQPWFLTSTFQNLRKNNAWFLQSLLEYEPYKFRAPGKQECYLILESLNAKSKDTSGWGRLHGIKSIVQRSKMWIAKGRYERHPTTFQSVFLVTCQNLCIRPTELTAAGLQLNWANINRQSFQCNLKVALVANTIVNLSQGLVFQNHPNLCKNLKGECIPIQRLLEARFWQFDPEELDTEIAALTFTVRKLWSGLRALWRNSPRSSSSQTVQSLKDAMLKVKKVENEDSSVLHDWTVTKRSDVNPCNVVRALQICSGNEPDKV